MSQNLKAEFNLPTNAHAHSTEHTRKVYTCDQCYNTILIGSFCIVFTEEKQEKYGRSFDNRRFCSRLCFTQFLIPKYPIYNKKIATEIAYSGTDKGDY